MIADGNGFRTVRVPRHVDYSARGARLGFGLTSPRGAISATVLRVSS